MIDALLGPYRRLASVSAPSATRGYADSPLLASWEAKVARGEPVTVAEHNTMLAHIAWCRTTLALIGPMDRAPVVADRDGSIALWLGTPAIESRPTEAGWRPSGSADAPAAPRITDAERAEWCRVADGMGTALWWDVSQIRVTQSPAGVPILAAVPAFLSAVPAGVYWIAAAGVFAFAGYSAFVDGERIQSEADVERVRIAERTTEALQVVQARQQLDAMTARWAEERVTGRSIEPSPVETRALTPREPTARTNSTTDALKELGQTALAYGAAAVAVTGVAALGIGAFERAMMRRRLRRVGVL